MKRRATMYKALGITASGIRYTANALTPKAALSKLLNKSIDYVQIIITRLTIADIRQGRE